MTTYVPAGQSDDRNIQALITGRRPSLEGARISRIRFDSQELSGSASHSVFVDCQFVKCELHNFQIFGTRLINCDFDQTKIDVFGARDRDGTESVFETCNFRWKNIRNLSLGAKLKHCSVNGTMTRCCFHNSAIDTNFSGKFVDSELGGMLLRPYTPLGERLRPSKPTRVEFTRCDFSDMKLFDVEFNNADVTDCAFPDLANRVIVDNYSSVLRKIISVLERHNIKRDLYVYKLRRSGDDQKIGILGLDSINEFITVEAAKKEIMTVIQANLLEQR